MKKLVAALSAILAQPATVPPKPPANNLLNALCKAIEKHEGFKAGTIKEVPTNDWGFKIVNGDLAVQRGTMLWLGGTKSWRNCNPGNARYSHAGYMMIYGDVYRDKDNFAIFESYETGFLYLKNLVLTKARRHPDWNLVQFIGDESDGWAPASDNNNVTAYATALANALGVSKTDWKLSNLLS